MNLASNKQAVTYDLEAVRISQLTRNKKLKACQAVISLEYGSNIADKKPQVASLKIKNSLLIKMSEHFG